MDQLFDLDSGLNIEIDIWDDYQIQDYHIWLKSESGFEYFHEKVAINSLAHKIEYNFDFSNVHEKDVIIKVRVRDNENNKVEKEIRVSTED